jgi:predicted DNA-binding transcriptional regulator AlpA
MAAKKQQLRGEAKRRRTEERRQRREARRQRIALSPITINPHVFYRMAEWGEAFFGFAASQLETKIRTGEIPKPVALSDTGRARGWFGRDILDWQNKRRAKAAADAA